MEEITVDEVDSIADKYISDIGELGYPENWTIEKTAEETVDQSNHWLLLEIWVSDIANIQLYYRPEDHKVCIWVWVDGEMKRSCWGRGADQIVELSKEYIEDLNSGDQV